MTERPDKARRPAGAKTKAKPSGAHAVDTGSMRAEAGHRLIADAMLAKLARWLRLAGIEVESAQAGDDAAILGHAKRTHATLLTSDVELFKIAGKRGVSALLIDQKDLDGQLAHTAAALGLRIEAEPERALCPMCGSRLRTVSKGTAMRHGLEASIAERYDTFYLCGRCDKIYWRGTHWQRIVERLRSVRALAAEGI